MKYLLIFFLMIGCSSKAPDNTFYFKLGQKVMVDPSDRTVFSGCLGYIVGGWDTNDGPMYHILLKKCPMFKYELSHTIQGGQEYLQYTDAEIEFPKDKK